MNFEIEIRRGRFLNRGSEMTGLHMAQIANKAIIDPNTKIRWWWGDGMDIHVDTLTGFMSHVTKYPIFIDSDHMIASRLWAYHDKNHQNGYTEFIDLLAVFRTPGDDCYVFFVENATIDGTDTVVPFFKVVNDSGMLVKTFGLINKPYESGKETYAFKVDEHSGDNGPDTWTLRVDMKESPYKSMEVAKAITDSVMSFFEDYDDLDFGAINPVDSDQPGSCPDYIKKAIETESKGVFNVYKLIGK